MEERSFAEIRSRWKRWRFVICFLLGLVVVFYVVFAAFLREDNYNTNSSSPVPENITSYDYAYYVLKPIPVTLLIILVAAHVLHGISDKKYNVLIIVGLFFSLLGDVFLMFNGFIFFMLGLIGFALAHIFYICAFCTRPPFLDEKLGIKALRLIPYLLYGAAIISVVTLQLIGQYFTRTFPGTTFKTSSAVLAGPVIVYGLIIVTMGWRSAARVGQFHSTEIGKAQVVGWFGAIAFIISDSLLSINLFLIHIPYAGAWVGITYWLGQTLIALSVDKQISFVETTLSTKTAEEFV